MNRSESKYFNTAVRMDKAFLQLLEKKDFEYITIREICETAGVNRSTFYLHYENTNDLLAESISYMNDQFLSYFNAGNAAIIEKMKSCPKEELLFIEPEYLLPYLTYVRENRKLFRTAIRKSASLHLEQTYEKLFQHVFDPILDRFDFPVSQRKYIMAFYIHGLIAIVLEWIENDCSDPIEHIIEVIMRCVPAYSVAQ